MSLICGIALVLGIALFFFCVVTLACAVLDSDEDMFRISGVFFSCILCLIIGLNAGISKMKTKALEEGYGDYVVRNIGGSSVEVVFQFKNKDIIDNKEDNNEDNKDE